MKKAMLVVYILIAAYIIVFLFGMHMAANAQDMSTWRYGSPNDVRQAGINAAQRGDQFATAVWMDLAVRAGSPELYRYTQPQPPQINIYNNVTVYADPASSGVTLGDPNPVGTVDYVKREARGYMPPPRYPAGLVP